MLAREKQNMIKEKFKEWLFAPTDAFAKSRRPIANISARQAVFPFVSTVTGLLTD